LIKNLEAEKEELLKDLRLAESKANEKRDEIKTETLGDLLEDKDSIQSEINEAKDHSKELDAKLLEWEKKIRSKRREVGGSNAGAQFAASSKKQEKVFENRLDNVSCFNKIKKGRFHIKMHYWLSVLPRNNQ
jgi:chromosome segregation ATPase